ncbi:MAG TPA: hypothetical protein P5572_14805, partial [Phycisphaerae bacterium]|nr:hypothetical protein [Phycisphaerae bacterium]
RNHVGDAFDVSPLVGIDECIPTVAPCVVDGIDLPDHGEAWTRAWRLDDDRLSDGCVATELRLMTRPLCIRRELRLTGATLRLDYTLENLSAAPVDYAWALHPLLAMRAGDRIEVAVDDRLGRVDTAAGIAGLTADDTCTWPQVTPEIRADGLRLGDDLASLKLYLPTPEPAQFAVVNDRDGTALRGRYGPAENLPYLGVWITRGGWNGYHHFALEPTNTNADRLQRDPTPATQLPAGALRQWFVEWTLGA